MAIAFPKLKKLKIEKMNELVELELLIARDNKKIMPCLRELVISGCLMLRALPPGLGKLESLEHLKIWQLSQVKYIGKEFYGLDDHNDCSSNSSVMAVTFRKLKVLVIIGMNELVEWELLIARDNKKIMPCLRTLELWDCPMLRALPSLGTLESLESLSMFKLPMIEQVGFEFLRISATDEFGGGEGEQTIVPNPRNLCSAVRKGRDKQGEGSSSSYVPKTVFLFPKLTHLWFDGMKEWEVWILPLFEEDIQIMPRLAELEFSKCPKLRALPDLTRFKSLEILFIFDLKGLVEIEREEGISSLPCLRKLRLSTCTSLRVIPGYLFPHTLRELRIAKCVELRGGATLPSSAP